jgi:hypothetical protein
MSRWAAHWMRKRSVYVMRIAQWQIMQIAKLQSHTTRTDQLLTYRSVRFSSPSKRCHTSLYPLTNDLPMPQDDQDTKQSAPSPVSTAHATTEGSDFDILLRRLQEEHSWALKDMTNFKSYISTPSSFDETSVARPQHRVALLSLATGVRCLPIPHKA